MEIIRDFNFKLEQTAVCIGKFDGLHKGHRLLFDAAKKTNLPVVMFTFQMLQPKGLYDQEEKELLAKTLGIDYMISVTVTEEFMHMSAMQFVDDILVKKCGAKEIFIGTDFAFGYQRSGTAAMLKTLETSYGFHVTVMEKVKANGQEISSTLIRDKIEQGRLAEANEWLSTPYFIKGTVISGNQLGRQISVPTANIIPTAGKILPPRGVYTVLLQRKQQMLQGVANLGTKPTVSGDDILGLEISIFDFEEELYGEEIIVYLLDFLRHEKKFASLDELKKQIELDIKRAKRSFHEECFPVPPSPFLNEISR